MEMLGSIKNRITTRIIPNKKILIELDKSSRDIVEKMGTQSNIKWVTGLINFETRKMYLLESSYHDALAIQNDLRSSEHAFGQGWYGFSLLCKDLNAGLLKVFPRGGHGGGIPIKYSPAFEGYIVGIFGGKAERILFEQMIYERQLPDDVSIRWTKVLHLNDKLYVPKSLSNAKLERLVSKLQLSGSV